MHTTSNILLIRPSNFTFNSETATSNAFQKNASNTDAESIHLKAIEEFDAMVKLLNANEINIFVFNDTPLPHKPDAIFPNNWVSFHADGTVVLYPMCAISRQAERRMDIIESLRNHFSVTKIIDLSHYEQEHKFLEGTGSIIFDHTHKIAYACLSCRTDKHVLEQLCEAIGYKSFSFYAYDRAGKEIYHTNVMMSIGKQFAIVCIESITDKKQREEMITSLQSTKHEVIAISIEQMNHFAGNMLEVQSKEGKAILALSETAHRSLTENQKNKLANCVDLLPCSINTIEIIGGGSARCMMAELFLPVKTNQ